MTVNSINNILYLKETKLDQNEAKRADRGKSSTENLAQKKNDVADVVEENRAAVNPSIDDLDQARQVLRSLVDMMGQKQDKTMMAHSGKAITQVF